MTVNIEENGFKLDAAGKVRSATGKLLTNEVAEQVKAGAIIGNFSMADLKKKRARAQASGEVDMVEALHKISPTIGMLAVGQTAKIPITPGKDSDGKDLSKRSFVMSIVTKLNQLTSAGREWAGRVFDQASDAAGEYYYVSRMPDTDTPPVRKTGTGRKKAASADDNLAAAMQRAKEHLNGKDDAPKVEGEEPKQEVMEDAQVLTH